MVGRRAVDNESALAITLAAVMPLPEGFPELAFAGALGGRRVPLSSIKSMTGHCMGAASAVEAVSCVQSILFRRLPPTIGLEHQDPICDVEVVGNAPREHDCRILLNNALAFGGYDAVLCLARPGVLPPTVGEG